VPAALLALALAKISFAPFAARGHGHHIKSTVSRLEPR
jgi:hypothetical protein